MQNKLQSLLTQAETIMYNVNSHIENRCFGEHSNAHLVLSAVANYLFRTRSSKSCERAHTVFLLSIRQYYLMCDRCASPSQIKRGGIGFFTRRYRT